VIEVSAGGKLRLERALIVDYANDALHFAQGKGELSDLAVLGGAKAMGSASTAIHAFTGSAISLERLEVSGASRCGFLVEGGSSVAVRDLILRDAQAGRIDATGVIAQSSAFSLQRGLIRGMVGPSFDLGASTATITDTSIDGTMIDDQAGPPDLTFSIIDSNVKLAQVDVTGQRDERTDQHEQDA